MAICRVIKGGEIMDECINGQIEALKGMLLLELQEKYKKMFNARETPCDNKVFLLRRIAYRLQEMKCGGLSSITQGKINELIAKYDPVNNKALRPTVISAGKEFNSLPLLRDKRLPIPGTVIRKKYKGELIQVKVLEKGFEYDNKYYKSLSSIAFKITKSRWNGYNFFNL